jgi:hypothetical protein
MDHVKLIDVEDIAEPAPDAETFPAVTKEFLLGGHAYFTVTNPKGNRLRYVIKARAGKRGTQWNGTVSYYLRVYHQGSSGYRYVGVVQEDGSIVSTGQAAYLKGTLEYDIAAWALSVVFQQVPIRVGYAITHNDKCGKCAAWLVDRGDRETGFHLDCMRDGSD